MAKYHIQIDVGIPGGEMYFFFFFYPTFYPAKNKSGGCRNKMPQTSINPWKVRRTQLTCLSCTGTRLRQGFLQPLDLHCPYQILVIPEIEDQILSRRYLVLVLVFFFLIPLFSQFDVQCRQSVSGPFLGTEQSHHEGRGSECLWEEHLLLHL